jgi:hypothetical protein
MVWTFAKRGEHMTIARVEDSCTLVVTPAHASSRTHVFADANKLFTFQRDMETFLLNTGWAFVKFSPERRSGIDRRNFPRLNERRRWWTDGIELAKVVWGG